MIPATARPRIERMRCYFMRGSHVEFLKDASDDELIRQALAVFDVH
jgi:hypothetical protein